MVPFVKEAIPAKPIRTCRAQSLVEFALVLPLLALMLFAVIQYGFLFSAYMTLRHGMHVGARTASLPGTNNIQTVVGEAITPMLDRNRLGPIVRTDTAVGGVSAVQVSGTYGVNLILPFVVPGNVGNTLTITASATYRK